MCYETAEISSCHGGHFHRPFIISGYRKPNSDMLYFLKSAFYLHNETFNIWSHAVGTLYFLAVLVYECQHKDELIHWPMIGYATVLVYLFACSTLAHTFGEMSPEICDFLYTIDVIGIRTSHFVCMLLGYFYNASPEYVAVSTYLGYDLHIVSFVAIYTAGNLMETVQFQRPVCSDYEFKLITLALPLLVCGVSVYLMIGFWPQGQYLVIGGIYCCKVTAGFIYTARFPERYIPGGFDYFGNSHHWVHVFSLVGFIILYHVVSAEMHDSVTFRLSGKSIRFIFPALVVTLVVPLLSITYMFLFKKHHTSNCNTNSRKKMV